MENFLEERGKFMHRVFTHICEEGKEKELSHILRHSIA